MTNYQRGAALETPRANRWLFGLVLGIIGGLLAVLAEHVIFPPRTVAQVDLVSLVSEHVRGLDLTFLTEAERSLEAARFAARLEQETARLSHDFHAVILTPPAVISGAPDLTEILRSRIAEKIP